MRWGLFFGKRLVEAKVKLDELYESIYFGVGLAYNWIMVIVGYPLFGILFGWKGFIGWFVFRWLSIPYQHCMDMLQQFRAARNWRKSNGELDSLRETVLSQLNRS